MERTERDEAALEDQAYTCSWIQDNLHLFAPLARDGFQLKGRGAILVNVMELILRRHYEEGHPFNYHPPTDEWLESDEISSLSLRTTARHFLASYVPEREFVLLFVNGDRSVVQRVPFPHEEEIDTEIRGAYVNAEKQERHNRLTCTDFWARAYRLTSPFTAEWLYRVA